MPEDYLKPIPEPTSNGFDNPAVKEALAIVSDWTTHYSTEFSQRDALNREMDYAMNDVRGTRGAADRFGSLNSTSMNASKLTTQILYAARRVVVEQLGLHEFVFKGGNISDSYRALVQAAYESFLDKAGYDTVLTNNDALVGTGDQFFSWFWNPNYQANEEGFPVKIKSQGITKTFFPVYATAIRNHDDDREANKFVRCIFRGQWDRAVELFPWIVEKGGTAGEIPVNKDDWNLDKQTIDKRSVGKEEERLTEVFEFVDQAKKFSVEFAGRTAVFNDPLKGDDFPYIGHNNEAILPIYHRKFFRLNAGLLGSGVFQAAYRIAIIDRALQNMGITYEMFNLNAIKIISVSQDSGETEEGFTQKHREALQAQIKGREGVIFSRDVNNIGTTHTPPLINELLAMLELLEKNLARIGITFQLQFDPNKPLGVAEIEVENQSRAIRSIQKKNATEIQAFHNDFLGWLVKNISEDDNTPLNISVPVRDHKNNLKEVSGVQVTDENGQNQLVQFTVGNLVRAIKNNGFWVVVNPNSGVVNPQIFQRAIAREKFNSYVQLGASKAAAEALKERFALDGETVDLTLLENVDLQNQGQAQGATPQAAPQNIGLSQAIPA